MRGLTVLLTFVGKYMHLGLHEIGRNFGCAPHTCDFLFLRSSHTCDFLFLRTMSSMQIPYVFNKVGHYNCIYISSFVMNYHMVYL